MIGLDNPDHERFFEHTSTKAALLTGFWFMLRSIEYLADDAGIFDPDRSLTWSDITCRKDGRIIPLSRISEATEVTITVFSGKNTLETCTRTLHKVPDSECCVVAALANVYKAIVSTSGCYPAGNRPVFAADPEGKVPLSRKDISDLLKTAAAACGIPEGRVASHSLRRGACSQYIASGLPDPHVMRFGRWTSNAYQAYVFGHASALQEALQRAVHLVPRFERN